MAFISFQPHDHFDCPTWTGSDSTTTINGMAFKPDSLWINNYSGTGHPVLNNSTGGTAKNWIPSGDNAVDTTVYVASYTSDGFTLTGNIANTNDASDRYVGACWKANGGTTSTNTAGAIDSTVQANTTAGISIVQFTGTGGNTTVGHGLGVAPKYIIVKALGTSGRGRIYNGGTTFVADPQTDSGNFAIANAFADEATAFNDTATTSTVFSLGSSALSNASGQECIAYVFAEVQGFSKFGFYSGTGNIAGTKVYCGFKPKWIMIKSTTLTDNWGARSAVTTGFGLGVAPKYIIVKALGTSGRGRSYNGGTTFVADPQTDSGIFAIVTAFADDATAFNDTATTSTVFSLGSSALSNASGQECIAYVFAEIQGFSKFGFYSGTGNARGTKVYCGFKPKWLMIKSTTTTDDWGARSAVLTGYGLGGQRTRNIRFNTNTGQTTANVQFESNGFRLASTSTGNNQENTKYNYMAFAEMPMVGTNGTIALAT